MAESRDASRNGGSTYWRSLRELYDPQSVSDSKAHEFMAGVTDDFRLADLSQMSRKQFLALLSASAAFAAAGCSDYRDKGEIVPYSKKPEEITPGVPNAYASTCTSCDQSCGILIKTREGRPIKVDGNPDHPVNKGKICARGQASILNLYDPHRLRKPSRGSSSGNAGDLTWNQADIDITKALVSNISAGRKIAILTHPNLSPSSRAVIREFIGRFPTTEVFVYDVLNGEHRRRAWKSCYDSDVVPAIAWNKARVIVALEADFLGTEGKTIEQIRMFAESRDIMEGDEFNRLYSIEGSMSLTGTNADFRLRLRPDAQPELLLALLHAIGVERNAVALDPHIEQLVGTTSVGAFAQKYGFATSVIDRLADDLVRHRGKGIVYAGNALPEHVHILVNYLNHALGNDALYDHANVELLQETSSSANLETLIREMKSGKVGAVIHFDVNPVFELPPTFGYADALKGIPVSVALTEEENETSQFCTHVLPIHNPFESWGDYVVRSGFASLQQPVIAPLYDTRQKESVLLVWLKGDGNYSETMYHEFLKNRWEKEIYPGLHRRMDFPSFWYASLHDGIVSTTPEPAEQQSFQLGALQAAGVPVSAAGYVVALKRSLYLGFGRSANNGWLQELPHPVTKVVWDNYAALSERSARELGVENSDLIDVVLPHGTLRVPVFIQPGQADHYISIDLGYGRTNAGPIGTGVGAYAGTLLGRDALEGACLYGGATVTKAEGRYSLVSTQEQHSLDETFVKDLHLKRQVIREGTLDEYRRDPEFLHHEKSEPTSISKEVEYKGLKWAMAIDMNKCIGCNACVSGCNVENNIPVVGKDQVQRGRAMHWLRIDRYYAGTADEPSPSHQPMLCQHCDQAPCENVCPVAATNHSPDGLNQMVYNRCVGTKYCSNNCPYKVRRFNFYNFRDNFADGYYEQEPVSLVHNPEVTVRSRGVMEKCTFCVQRIMEAREHATERGTVLKGSDVKTACQEACPATAIVFGDMNDPDSEVSKYRRHNLGYHVLEDVNARPNVTYIAKLRNIDSEKLA